MPNLENIRIWVNALRSGNFKQIRQALHSEDGHCCLAVACEVSGLGYWAHDREDTKEEADNDGCYYVIRPEITFDMWSSEDQEEDEGDWSEEWMAPGVAEWLGLDANPEVFFMDEDGRKQKESLSVLNDDYGLNFNQIADIIEENFLRG